MKIRLLIAIAIVATANQLLATAVISQDAPTENKAEAAAEAFRLFKTAPAGLEVNGWMAIGNGALIDGYDSDLLDPSVTGINQLGLSMDKAGDKFRLHLDLVYGRDARYFRSFSNAGNGWDNSAGFQHGEHAIALPQAFVETAAGDWAIKAGHFLANGPSGKYSTDRFFATRTNAETDYSPITLTGVIGSRTISATKITIGWAAGTNTGFDNLNTDETNGTLVLGLERSLGDKVSFTYNALFGDMTIINSLEFPREDESYYHNLTLHYEVSERLRVEFTHVYNLWHLHQDFTVNTYRQTAYYVLNDRITLGQRYENTGQSRRNATEECLSVGMNYQNTRWSNVLLRPEIRWMNFKNEGGEDSQTAFFMDAVIRF